MCVGGGQTSCGRVLQLQIVRLRTRETGWNRLGKRIIFAVDQHLLKVLPWHPQIILNVITGVKNMSPAEEKFNR